MTKCWLVWNETKTEGVIFTNESDAKSALDGLHRFDKELGFLSISSLAESFFELYGDDECFTEEIETC